ncbi:hypothetical protein AGMMS50262_21990 [Bacteroidia bacterium]|nr:hypothetical protein AGMMS50262_21990 [Bacteroidia bacterium]
MKTIYFIYVVLCCTFLTTIVAFSQSIPLLKADNRWSVLEEDHSEGGFPDENPYKISSWLKTGNDSVVNEKTYKVILSSTDREQLNWEDKGLLMREENGKVFWYNKEEIREDETLLYDFNLQEGDSIFRYLQPKWDAQIVSTVDSIRYIQIDKTPRKIFYLTNQLDVDGRWPIPEIWIEGIGSSWGLKRECICYFVTGCQLTWNLLCFYENEEEIYHSPDFDDCYYHWVYGIKNVESSLDFQIYPNPSSGKFTLKTDTKNKDCFIQIFDVNGKQIYSYQLDNSGYLEVDLSKVPSGTYLVQLKKQNLYETKKIVIDKK